MISQPAEKRETPAIPEPVGQKSTGHEDRIVIADLPTRTRSGSGSETLKSRDTKLG